MAGHAGNSYRQISYAGRCDNGSETGATWKYQDGTCGDTIANATNRTFYQVPDENFRLRIRCHNDSGDPHTIDHYLDFRHEGDGWRPVQAGEEVEPASSSGFTDGDDSTQQMGSGTYDGTNGAMDDADALIGSFVWDGSADVEFEFCLKIDSTKVSDNDLLEFRMVTKIASPIVYANYNIWGRVLVEIPAAPQNLDPPAASTSSNAPAGTLSASGSADLDPPAASTDTNAPAGTLDRGGAPAPQDLDPPAASTSSNAPAGALDAAGSADLDPAAASSSSDAPAGALDAAGSADLDPASASSSSDAPAGAIAASGSADLDPPAASSASNAPPGTLTSGPQLSPTVYDARGRVTASVTVEDRAVADIVVEERIGADIVVEERAVADIVVEERVPALIAAGDS